MQSGERAKGAPPQASLQLAPGVDLRASALSAEERALAERVQAKAPWSQLLRQDRRSPRAVLDVLSGLLVRGVLQDASFDERVELEPAQKAQLLLFDRALSELTPFEVLGVAPSASADEVKSAYYEASRRFHPDRYFGRELGSYRARMDRVFRALTEAQHALADGERRKQVAHAPGVDVSADRAAERRARLAKHPYLAKLGAAGSRTAAAKALLAQGNRAAALMELQQALGADPRNEEARRLMDSLRAQGEDTRVRQVLARAKREERAGTLERALASYREVLALEATHVEALRCCAELLVRQGGALKEARALAAKAVEAGPTDVAALLTLGRLAQAEGDGPAAQKCYARVLQLDPHNAEAKKHARPERLV